MMEYPLRASIVAPSYAWNKLAEVIPWFMRTMVKDICREWKACESKEEFTTEWKAHAVWSFGWQDLWAVTAAEETVDFDVAQSYGKIVADLGGQKWTIWRLITQDIGHFSYGKSQLMLMTEASKESKMVLAAALLSIPEHELAEWAGSSRIKTILTRTRRAIIWTKGGYERTSWRSL